MNKQNICNNCGKIGHLFHQCRNPITSYGIIAFRILGGKTQYLMIRRKDTFAYIEFLRGKYVIHNKDQLISLFELMSNEEKEKIINKEFDELWNEMWGEGNNLLQYKREEISSQRKFQSLKQGIHINGEDCDIESLIRLSKNKWVEAEWEFPKGRKNYQERDVDCAIREFEEETGYNINSFIQIENMMPFEEIFLASNNKSYKHKYYLAFMPKNIDILDKFQVSEVSKIEWKNFDNCISSIRHYNSEKKDIIIKIDNLLKQLMFSTY